MSDDDRHAAARILLSQGVPVEFAEDLWKAAAFSLVPQVLQDAFKESDKTETIFQLELSNGARVGFTNARPDQAPGWISIVPRAITAVGARSRVFRGETMNVRLAEVVSVRAIPRESIPPREAP